MTRQTGIELELWVVDGEGRLTDGRDIAAAHDRIEPEFVTSMLEVQTAPRATLAALGRDLQEVLSVAVRAAHVDGQRLVPLGTPLTDSHGETHTQRGELFERIYGDGVACAKNCAGAHLHFERDQTVRQLNALTALDPALALVSSAPYYRGTGVQSSARANAYRRECGEAFQQFCDLWPYADSLDDWQGRVDDRFAAFESLARDRGVEGSTVAEAFTPEDTVLTPVRLRERQPTVEWRAPDSGLPSELLRLAGDVRAVVSQTASKPVTVGKPGVHDEYVGVPTYETLQGMSKAAINFGLDPSPVRGYLRKFGIDYSAYRPLSPRIADGHTVTESTARSLRLDQADRLEADIDGPLGPDSSVDGLPRTG